MKRSPGIKPLSVNIATAFPIFEELPYKMDYLLVYPFLFGKWHESHLEFGLLFRDPNLQNLH